jgi:CubicO group peptidase (beta-lactamase class C family)
MRKRLWYAVLALTIAAAFAPPAAARILSQGEPADFQTVDDFVRSQMRRHRIPGLALAVTQGDDIVHLQAFGTAEGDRPVTPDTPFFIGSVSKSFTALAVMQLVEAGEVDLDASVRRYIPWFAVADGEASNTITIRHLLHHTSGLSETGYRRGSVPQDTTLEETVRDLERAELTAPVGTTHQYFNLNYNVLGLIIQQVSGQSYGAYVEDHIFEPLGMENSFVSREPAEQAGLAQGHNVILGFPIARHQPFVSYDLPAGMIIASAADMARYAVAQNNGGCVEGICVLSAEGIEAMHTPPEGVDTGYAMGWELREENDPRRVGHNGAVRTFFSSLTLLPEQELGIVLLINQNSIFHLLMAYDNLVDGVVTLLVGGQPSGGIAMALLYGIIGAVILVDLALHVLRFARLPRWRRRWQHHGSRVALLGLALRGLVALAILIGVPVLLITQAGTDATRVMLLHYMPGITAWLALSAVLNLVEIGAKFHWALTWETR